MNFRQDADSTLLFGSIFVSRGSARPYLSSPKPWRTPLPSPTVPPAPRRFSDIPLLASVNSEEDSHLLNSKAVHRACAKRALMKIPALEDYEQRANARNKA